MRQAQTRRNGWRWLALAVGTLSALSLAEASLTCQPRSPARPAPASASARSSCRQTAPRHW